MVVAIVFGAVVYVALNTVPGGGYPRGVWKMERVPCGVRGGGGKMVGDDRGLSGCSIGGFQGG